MSDNDSNDNVFDLFGEPNEDEDENTEFEADPGAVAFMDQQAAEFNADEASFSEHYGFVHKCKCDKDYTDGNLVTVTECYANMTSDALEACAALNAENRILRAVIGAAMGETLSGMDMEESGNDGELDPEVHGDPTDDGEDASV